MVGPLTCSQNSTTTALSPWPCAAVWLPSIRKNYVAPERQDTFLRYLRAHKLNVCCL